MKARDWAGFILLGGLWGSSFLWIKIGIQELQPFTLVGFRLLFGALGLGIVMIARRGRPILEPRMVVILALLGLTNTGLPIALITWGEQFIDSGIAAILNSTVPFFSLVIAHFFLSDERITINKLIGLVVGFIGVVILLGRDIGSVDFKASLVGQLAVLGASVLYAGSAVYVRRNLKGITPTVQAFQITLMGDLWVWIGAFSLETPAFPTLTTTWIAALWLGLLGTFIAYLIYFNLIRNVGATRATMVTYLLPVFGVALGAIFLREQITLWVILGMALVIAGIYVVNSGVQVLPVRLQEAEEAGD